MVRDRHAPVRQTREGEGGQMNEGSRGQGQTDRRALEIRAAQHGVGGNDVLPEDLFGAVDVLQKKLESAQALSQTRRDVFPLGSGEKFGQHVAKPRLLVPRSTPARDVEVHPHLAHGRLEAFDHGANFAPRRGHYAVKQRTVNLPRRAVRVEYFVPERTFARLRFHRRDGFRRTRQGQGDTITAFARHAHRGACCGGGTSCSKFCGSFAVC